MKNLKGWEIRELWLKFWKSHGHDIVPGASLIPLNDPSLLWINAGVSPLKKYFDGRETPSNRRLANVQKSLRTNDIDNVGKTARHHTFFEMLGNFSIGDYFRAEVLPWAVEFLTKEEWLGIPLDKLYFTYYPDDLPTFNLWHDLGVAKSHLISVASNFWEIGEGPCGPDTEIFFDRGPQYDKDGLGIKLIKDEIENDRYVEIWNIVFSQYNAKAGQKREEYAELPSKNIDTGCGLERLACILQDVPTNFETDLFAGIIKKIEELTGKKYQGDLAFKVISDHIRSCVFALADGATFSNEGRGYVLRRLLRRAARYMRKLGATTPLLASLVKSCIDTMKVFYPYLIKKEEMIKDEIGKEEEKFLLTLDLGEKRLLDYIAKADNKKIPADVSFLLYDTFGFPLELTIEIAEENNFEVDVEGFKILLLKQKETSREARKKYTAMNRQNTAYLNFAMPSVFRYDTLELESEVIAVFKDEKRVKAASGDVLLVFGETPFYGEKGGQEGDSGVIVFNDVSYPVKTTIILPHGEAASFVSLADTLLKEGDIVRCVVDKKKRMKIASNHSATHLLNQALRCVLGNHIYQQGSSVSSDALRFDFNHYHPLTDDEILAVENLVNQEIKKNHPVKIQEMPYLDAVKLGAQAVFGEKYGNVVRVVDMDFSCELCGGTHVGNTGQIDGFAIISVETKGSGIYRIIAATGEGISGALSLALKPYHKEIEMLKGKVDALKELSRKLKSKQEIKIPLEPEITKSYQTIISFRNYCMSLAKQVKAEEKAYLKQKSNILSLETYLPCFQKIGKYNILIKELEATETGPVKDLIDRLTDKVAGSFVMFAVKNKKIVLVAKSKISQIPANEMLMHAAALLKGSGGGNQSFAQGGGSDMTMLDKALQEVLFEVKRRCEQ